MALLDKINSPDDVKALPKSELLALCDELRRFLIEHVSHSGGHLASNLGVVELTVALHRVFDTSADRLVFDVGHQCYVHKILTGRKAGFLAQQQGDAAGFRRLLGISGFPKPAESIHDAFAAGHASTSISAALGMARARSLQNGGYNCIALIGDGALTGGMAYEALNDAGHSGEPLIVILNDNEMSITRNVGGMSRYLARLRLKPQYFTLKKAYHTVIDPLPGGKQVDAVIHGAKNIIKDAMLPGSMFEGMGFIYLGPVNGHDVYELIGLLEKARDLKQPVLLHLTTTKGKGYAFSEEDPSLYHGVSAFDKNSGCSAQSVKPETFAHTFGDELTKLADTDSRICAITAAMRTGVGLDLFAKVHPKRFFDVAIAESHAVTMAAGLAIAGMRPVCAIYSTFLQRSYDQIIHDVALQRLPVIFMLDRAGLVGEDGETHHGVFNYLSGIPNMTVFAPASFAELRSLLRSALKIDGPVAIQYPRGGEGEYKDDLPGVACLEDGIDATLLTYGIMTNTALKVHALMKERGVSVKIIKLDRLKPISFTDIDRLVAGPLTVLEDNTGIIGTQIAAVRRGSTRLLNTGDRFIPHGTMDELLAYCGLDEHAVAASLLTNEQKA